MARGVLMGVVGCGVCPYWELVHIGGGVYTPGSPQAGANRVMITILRVL